MHIALKIIIFVTIGLFILLAILKFLFSLIGRKFLIRVKKRFTGQRIILQALNANFLVKNQKV